MWHAQNHGFEAMVSVHTVFLMTCTIHGLRTMVLCTRFSVGRSEKVNGKAKIGVGAEINIELLGGTDRVVVTDRDPNRFGFG